MAGKAPTYRIELSGAERGTTEVFRFRSPTHAEARRARTFSRTFDAEDFLLRRCVEGERNWDEYPGGTVRRLIDAIVERSELNPNHDYVDKAFEWFMEDESRLEILACNLFHVTLEHLDDTSPEYRTRYLLSTRFLWERLYGMPVERVIGLSDTQPEAPMGDGLPFLGGTAEVPVVPFNPGNIEDDVGLGSFNWDGG